MADDLKTAFPLAPLFQQQDQGFNLGGVGQNIGGALEGTKGMAEAQQDLAKSSLWINPLSGEASWEGTARQLQTIVQKASQFDDVQKNYRQMLARNVQQQENIRQHPFLNTLSQLAASFAANDPNPYTRAIGQAATRLNPTLPELEREQMGILQQQGMATGKEMAGDIAALRTGMEGLRQTRIADAAQQAQAGKTLHELGMLAQKGELPDAGLASQSLQASGMPKDKADAQAAVLFRASTEARVLREAAEAAKDERERKALEARAAESDKRLGVLMANLGMKQADKKEKDEALDAAARSLAKWELSAIRDISSFRGGDREKLFAKVKALNPDFTTAELNRRIKMQEYVDVGKGRQDIQSFDTFLQHGGEAVDVLKDISLSNVPAYNRPLNWWRKHMEGSPELTKLQVALEPVGKEFFSFLLGGRALYADDREKMKMLMDSNMSPKQIMAALNQYAKTAKDRYTAINQQYKRVMKKDIDNPFSEAALDAASKMGIDIGASGGGSSEEFPWHKK